MDFIVVFFRDVLDGPLYITIVVINTILICSCIGYLGDIYVKRKKAREKYNNTFVNVNDNSGGVSQVQQASIQQQQGK